MVSDWQLHLKLLPCTALTNLSVFLAIGLIIMMLHVLHEECSLELFIWSTHEPAYTELLHICPHML